MGGEPVQLDLLDGAAVRLAVRDASPEAIVHEATALLGAKFGRSLDATFAKTNLLRTTGTDNLLAAAREARVRRFVAQSFAPYRYARQGGAVKTEDDPLEEHPPKSARATFAAMRHLEQAVTGQGGIALRYGGFYGDEALADMIRKRRFPILGDGNGIFSLIHLDDAAAATVLALRKDGPAIYNVVDDDPAPARDWVPVLANVLGAKPPRRIPLWLAKAFAGKQAATMMAEARGASNAKAKRALGWKPKYPSWRQGFVAAYGASRDAPGRAR
jgi:nucleoside-diphosphate-sugar epimerase